MFLLLAAAHAGVGLDLGVGLRQDDNPYTGRWLSLSASARRHFNPYFAAEAGLAVRLPLGDQISGLTQVLVLIAADGGSTTFSQPVNVEVATVSLHAHLSPWKDPHEAKVGMWPYALVGVDLRFVEYAQATIDPDFLEGVAGADPAVIDEGSRDLRFLPSPTIGLGFDVWFADRIGVRIVVSERFALEKEPDYGNLTRNGEPEPLETIVTTSGTATVSAMVRF